MNDLVLEPTEMAQWQSLLMDAGTVCNIKLDEEIESYLVFMLMRYTRQPRAFAKALALDFLESQHEIGSIQRDRLRETADQCVLVAGLFPGLAETRLVKVSYFTNIAYSSYQQVADIVQVGRFYTMYQELSQRVVDIVGLLNCARLMSQSEGSAPGLTIKAWIEFLTINPRLQ